MIVCFGISLTKYTFYFRFFTNFELQRHSSGLFNIVGLLSLFWIHLDRSSYFFKNVVLYNWLSQWRSISFEEHNLSLVSTPSKRFVSILLNCCLVFEHLFFWVFVSNILDEIRFKRWIVACNNSRIRKMDPMSVHKRYRICRRHFDSECLNGGCRRLLNTAVPTLFLHSSSESNADSDESNNLFTTARNIIYIPVATDDTEEHFELVLTENKTLVSSNDVKGPHFCHIKLSIVVP